MALNDPDNVQRALSEAERRAMFERRMEFARLATLLRQVKNKIILGVFRKHSGTDSRN